MTEPTYSASSVSNLIETIRHSVIGDKAPIETPFGIRPLVYADYTASGRALKITEDFIAHRVLPAYANTHTESTFTGAQTTSYREQAREIIRNAVNATDEDAVIFCGSGATAAINRLIQILGLQQPAGHAQSPSSDGAQRPVVFIGPYEHHSNELPWRESIAEVVPVPLDDFGQIDCRLLTAKLKQYADRPLKIGSFSAASNVTGIRSDVPGVTRILKAHGALSFWDYAAAAPYCSINVNGDVPIDAVFISPHKFIGGPGSPGLLVAKRHLLTNAVPTVVGGGTVRYVTPTSHTYIDNAEAREEGGTPGIVESIRAGLAFKLQQAVGTDVIESLEHQLTRRALDRLTAHPNLEVLGNTEAERLSIISLRFKHHGKDLHYGFVTVLLNDLFGIQVRGGCSCAGPYGHSLLGMDQEYSAAVQEQIEAGHYILRPGWVRLNLNYFIGEEEFEYLLSALELVAEHGWRLLPGYAFNPTRGVWQHPKTPVQKLKSLHDWHFEPTTPVETMTFEPSRLLEEAKQILQAGLPLCAQAPPLPPDADHLRWFVLPEEAITQRGNAA